MKPEEVKLLVREGEGLTVEFKERYTPRIDEDIVAFANTKGGTILLGVRDDGTVTGDKLSNDLKGRINSLARNCKPAIAVSASQAGEVVAIEVPEGDEKPYSCSTGYYRRLNGSTQKMGHDEIRIMFRESDPVPFEERTVRGFTFDDVSREKVLAFTKESGVSIGETPVADFLKSLNVTDGATIRNAGIMFFAKDVHKHLSQAQMTLVAFKGTKKLNIYDRRDVRDDLLTQFREAEMFLQKHLNVRSEIKGFNREDIYEIPLEALREAVVNALMHRDYSITGTQVQVEVYDDRVEVINPGGLVRGMSRKSLGTLSLRRNETIADLFFRLHKVERIGMGVRKMKDAMAAAGLKEPEFDTNGFFRVVFHRSPEFAMRTAESVIPSTGEKTRDKTRGKTRNKIIALLRQDATLTVVGLAKEVGLSPKGVEWHIQHLKKEGRLKRVGSKKAGHWEVVG